jgi:uncharacterized membrane protein YraQ (UPF0718 family)
MNRDLLFATGVMAGIALAMYGIVAWKNPGIAAPGAWLGVKGFVGILPLLVFSFAIAGLVQVLVPKELVARWLGAESGFRGIGLGCLLGAITPGGPYISFPIAAAIFKSGAGISTMVAFITAWSLWAVARLPLEISLVGPELTLKRLAATLIFPPLAGILARLFFE